MLNLADWDAQNPCCYISSQGSSGHCSDPASRGPIAAVTLLSGIRILQHLTIYGTRVPTALCTTPKSQVVDLTCHHQGWAAATLCPTSESLNHNFDFYHWGSTAAVPHPILRVLNCGFVPTSLELNCCYYVNVPWGQRQNLEPPSPRYAIIATCHLGPSYCCTLLSQGLCQCCVTSLSP